MSTTLGTVKLNVRRLIRDLPVGSTVPAVPDEVLIATINSVYVMLSAELGYADTWTSAAVPLVAGTRVYQLSATDYLLLSLLRRHTDQVILNHTSEEQIQTAYQNAPSASGAPTDFALYEGADGKLNVDLYPTPNADAIAKNASLDAFLSAAVSALTAAGDTIALPQIAASALELLCAAECIDGMGPELLKQRNLSMSFGQTLRQRGQRMLDAETIRESQFRRTDSVLRVRF